MFEPFSEMEFWRNFPPMDLKEIISNISLFLLKRLYSYICGRIFSQKPKEFKRNFWSEDFKEFIVTLHCLQKKAATQSSCSAFSIYRVFDVSQNPNEYWETFL